MVDTLSIDYMQAEDSEILLPIEILNALQGHANWLVVNQGASESMKYLNLVDQVGRHILPLHGGGIICKYQGPALERTTIPKVQAQWLDILKEAARIIPKDMAGIVNYRDSILHKINWKAINPQRDTLDIGGDFLLYATASLMIQDKIIKLYLKLFALRLERINALEEEIIRNDFEGTQEAMKVNDHYIGGLCINDLKRKRYDHLDIKIILRCLKKKEGCLLELLTDPAGPLIDVEYLELENEDLFYEQMNKAHYLWLLKMAKIDAQDKSKKGEGEEEA